MGKIIGAKKGKVNKSTKAFAVFGILAVIVVAGFAGFFVFSYLQGMVVAPGETTVSATTFKVYAYPNEEDITAHCHLSIWTVKSDDVPLTGDEIRTLSHYEENIKEKDAEDISIDLSGETYVYVEVNPVGDQYWANNYHLIYGGVNKEYTVYAYHQASDVEGTVLDGTTMDEWDKSSDLTHGEVILDVPRNSTLELYKGGDFKISDTDYAALTTSEQAKYRDQRRNRCEAPTYDPLLDLDKDGVNDLEVVSNVFGIEYTFNDTVSLVDGAVTQVNFTILDTNDIQPPIKVVYSATKIYCLFTQVIDFQNGAYTFNFEIALASNISCSAVKSVRVPVPYEDTNLGTPVVLSTFPI